MSEGVAKISNNDRKKCKSIPRETNVQASDCSKGQVYNGSFEFREKLMSDCHRFLYMAICSNTAPGTL